MWIFIKFRTFLWICRINGAGGKVQGVRSRVQGARRCGLECCLFVVMLVLGLVGCGGDAPLPTVVPLAVLLPPPPTPILAATELRPATEPLPATATAVSPPTLISAETAVPPDIITAAQQIAHSNPNQFQWTDDVNAADLQLVLNVGQPFAEWVYAVAAPFPTVADGISLAEIQSAWQGDTQSFVIASSDLPALKIFFGSAGTAVSTTPSAELVDTLWKQRPSYTILPFHQLTPRLKVMQLDGISPHDPDFDLSVYPLVLSVGIEGEETAVSNFLTTWNGSTTNRDPAKITRVAMTGVTALVRATAHQMELNGVSYPGTAVSPILTSADITHVSNEVSFSATCAYPDPFGGTSFCSRDSYFQLLTDIGVDVVELTGNHLNDLGRENLIRSLEMYTNAGMSTFGGGADLAEAEKPLLITHNNNQIAFLGCNPVGPTYAWATADLPGSRPCDDGIYEQISELNEDGYVVIATQQYHEFYHYAATAQQQVDFKKLAAAGATAVSGSQGHHAQGFDFHNGAFIHYGLGNLFFDQMNNLGTRQTFVDTYVIYDNQLISIDLWTGLIENYARPRDMTPQERTAVLTATFNASEWKENNE